MSETLGKKAERKIKEWLNRPEEGYWFYRIPDQLGGIPGECGGANPCDFFLYKYPNLYAIESKATEHDRFDFSMITDYQHEHLRDYAKVDGVTSYVVVLFATYKRAFLIEIGEIDRLISEGTKSINIKKIDKWTIQYKEIVTLPSRKELLDYSKENNVL